MKEPKALVFPPKKILVPLDMSDASETAWKYAKDLGAAFKAQVDGLYVKEWLFYGQYAPMMADVLPSIDELRRRLGAGDEIKAVSGTIEGTILMWGRELDYDLVVMGTHARTGLERLLRGSIAEAVVRSSEIPVLVVRGNHKRWSSVLAPINFEPYAQRGLEVAARVARAMNAGLTVMHCVEAPLYGDAGALKGPRRLLEDAVAGLPPETRQSARPRTEILFGEPVEQIASAGKNADLIVLSGHHKGLLSDIVLGTTTQRLLRHCDTPLLVLPSRAEVKALPLRRKGAATAVKGE